MKFIQVNVQEFTHYQALFDYLKVQNADVVTMQEVTIGQRHESTPPNALHDLTHGLSYSVEFSPKFEVLGVDGSPAARGNAILYRGDLVSTMQHYIPSFGTETQTSREAIGLHLDENASLEIRQKIWLAQQHMPSSFLEVVLDREGHDIHVVTTHFPATNRCQETQVIREHAKYLVELTQPRRQEIAIVAGDLNMVADSDSVRHIESIFTNTASKVTSTLHRQLHPAFRFDPTFPEEGLHVDHVFYRNCECFSWKIDEVDVSDHYPVVCEFSF